jgi:hypothetical protein
MCCNVLLHKYHGTSAQCGTIQPCICTTITTTYVNDGDTLRNIARAGKVYSTRVLPSHSLLILSSDISDGDLLS